MQTKTNKTVLSFRPQAGYTLIELVITTALSSLLSAYFFLSIIMTQRLYESTIADIELSLQSRILREKLLFNIVEGEGGLMSASRNCFEYGNALNPTQKCNTVAYRMYETGPKTTLTVTDRKLVADREDASKLRMPSAVLASPAVFARSSSGTQLSLTLDLVIEQGTRQYRLLQEVPSPFLNN